jgi:DNA-binding NarL/FixJ family response regulator
MQEPIETHPTQAQAETAGPLRVMVVDADRRVRQSLAGLIELDDELSLTGATGTADECLRLLQDARPDIVLLDPDLPDPDVGLGLLDEIVARWPDLPVVVMNCAESLEGDALRRGATAFVCKDGRLPDFLSAVRRRPAGASG